MPELDQRVRQFHQTTFIKNKSLYEQLYSGQNPEVLFITCSDSRIIPSELTQSKPGEIFVIRNAGNIIPAYPDNGGESATVEYALTVLNIKHIIVCGHSQCGAMKGLLQPETTKNMPTVSSWLHHAPNREQLVNAYNSKTEHDLLNKAIAENVLLQIEHLKLYPSVKAKLDKNEITIHAWVYTFETGDVQMFNHELNRFVPLIKEEKSQKPQSTLLFDFIGTLSVGIGRALILLGLLIIAMGTRITRFGEQYISPNNRFFTLHSPLASSIEDQALTNKMI